MTHKYVVLIVATTTLFVSAADRNTAKEIAIEESGIHPDDIDSVQITVDDE